ncbi:BTAD domain-containing putative transcriptional regulator [Streptomyces sp. B1866]|uniref:AfsR/SARP family transcriptional regulator n=1 Tax=Streptomyces sp. B1866 TaxID=3075431 RepID=UPI00289071AA|nr:BTAD domain-containing putative transcriptional regulator [Streptomyces sp. B1866]MDT3399638.1 BTAD domain-containing putative transcriptional regulator [Streptomyces sp. B1866]
MSDVAEAGAGARPGPRIRILGPVAVEVGGREVTLGPQQRTLLAALALARGRPVSRARLTELMWEGAEPDGADAALRAHIRNLRRVLEPDRRARDGFDALVSAGGRSSSGYALKLADEQVDALRFVRLTEQAREAARAGETRLAVERYDQALAQWSGPALAGVADRGFALAEARRLEELHLVAREERVEALLAQGRHQEVIGELTALVREHRLRERLWAQLILALYRSGRQADALAAYRDVHRLLAEEVGVEPGRPLRELHQRILADDPDLTPERPRDAAAPEPPAAPQPVPRQLPPDVASFTGRAEQVRELDVLLSAMQDRPGRALVISSVSGTAGVGKTTLAVHWMHRVADRFPDGQLYVDLCGYSPTTRVSPGEALARMLRALGVSPGRLPEAPDERGALYRSLLADKRVLVLLDNAASLEQVRPLLPGSPSCFVVVTSRDDLRGLTAFHDAHRVRLDVFSEEEAVALLARTVGADTVRAEPEAAAEVVRLCGCLPLAVRVCAANFLGERHRRLAELARDLREGNRLAELALDGETRTGVRAAFDLSYRDLLPEDRRLFRLLGLAPGFDITVPAAAALTGADERETARGLDRLVARNLLETHREGRFRFHDLLRLYARERAEREDDPKERETAVRWALHWYQATAERAALATRYYVAPAGAGTLPEAGPPEPLDFDGPAAGLAWLNAERTNLLAGIHHAVEHGPRPFAWRVAETLDGPLMSQGERSEWVDAARAGLRAAAAERDDFGRALMHWSVAYATRELAQYEESIRHALLAAPLFLQEGRPLEAAGAWVSVGIAARDQGRLDTAQEHILRALDLARLHDNLGWEATCLAALGQIRTEQGLFGAARDALDEALALISTGTVPTLVANVGRVAHLSLGTLAGCMGEYGKAVDHLTRAQVAANPAVPSSSLDETVLCRLAAVHRDTGDLRLALKYATDALHCIQRTNRRCMEAEARNILGSVLVDFDDLAGAAEHHRAALRLAVDSGNPRAQSAAHAGLSAVYRHGGDPRAALPHAETARDAVASLGLALAEGEALTEVGSVLLALGQGGRAAQSAVSAVGLHRRAGYRIGLVRALQIAGDAHQALSDEQTAQRLRREAESLRAEMGVPLPR